MKLACLSLPVLRPSPAAAPRRIALAHLWCNMQLGTGSGSQSHGSAKRWRLEEPREAEPTAPKLLGEIPAKQKTPPGPGRTSNPDFGVTAEAIMPPVDAPVALAEAIRAVFPGVFDTASSAKKAIRRGEIHVDGLVRKCSWQVNGGEVLQQWQRVTSGHRMDPTTVPAHLSLVVLHESDTWAVVLKPEGIPTVVPSEPDGWTAERLLPYFLAHTTAPGAIWRPRTAHRLDSPTAGILCCGKTRGALKFLSQAFADRTATKRYRALLVGRLEGDGTVDTPLKDEKGNLVEALTHYKAVRHSCSRRWGCLTTVDLWPKTGRTHQLRRHMSGLGFPILGDKKYAKAYQILEGKGLFLFAAELTIPDPDDPEGQRRTVSASEPEKYECARSAEEAAELRDQSH